MIYYGKGVLKEVKLDPSSQALLESLMDGGRFETFLESAVAHHFKLRGTLKVGPERFLTDLCQEYRITLQDIRVKKPKGSIVRDVKKVACALLPTEFGLTEKETGRLMNLDHTTINDRKNTVPLEMRHNDILFGVYHTAQSIIEGYGKEARMERK